VSVTTEIPPARSHHHPVLMMTLLGMLGGGLLGWSGKVPSMSLATPHYDPLPHQVAKYPGGISLRFAMVHDVIHERYAKHGAAYYRVRNESARGQFEPMLAAAPAGVRPDEAAWRLMDDVAVGHVHLGEYDRAVELMREKLERQGRLGISGRDLYSTYANLGTAMMIGALVKMNGGGDATAELRESVEWVDKAVKVNPEAHFGREVWQVVLGDFLLDAAQNPQLLLAYDFTGNRLRLGGFPSSRGGPSTAPPSYTGRWVRPVLERTNPSEMDLGQARRWITTVGAEGKWNEETHTAQPEPVAFDEPVLGIVGMWRYGGGANPHFSLALAEIMSRVGQRHIAWSAYERTIRLLDGFSNKKTAKQLLEHCKLRQEQLEANMDVGPDRLRAAFDADLKAGLDHQSAYQAYEAKRLAEGASIDDPHFYDAFLSQHGDIASPTGHADEVTWISTNFAESGLPLTLLGGGLFGLPTALVVRRREGRG
jgi:hypothetical protein